MNYFSHAILLQKNNPYRSWQIYQVVYNSSLRYYAMKIYGAKYEDALDMAYRHILENYDEDKGELEHYATSVVGTINLGAYKKEISYDEMMNIVADKNAFKSNNGDPLDLFLESESKVPDKGVGECVKYLLPFFVKDFKFFKSRKSTDRTLVYSDLYNLFSVSTVMESINFMASKYTETVEKLYALKKKMKFRGYDGERYKKSLNMTVEYICELNGVILYKKEKGRTEKVLYEININEVLANVITMFYKDRLVMMVGEMPVYISLSGKFIFELEELLETLENEIIGCILSRLSTLSILRYERGNSIILVSSNVLALSAINIDILDSSFFIDLVLKSSRCIEKQVERKVEVVEA